MTVLYDDRGFRQTVGGVSKSFFETITHLPKHILPRLGIIRTPNLLLQGRPFYLLPERKQYDYKWLCAHVMGSASIKGLGFLFEKVRRMFPEAFNYDAELNFRYFCNLAKEKDVDVVHLTEPHLFRYNWRRSVSNKPFVVTVHDLTPELLLGDVYIKPYRKMVLDAADAIVAVSNFTKQQVIKEYGINSERISVVYHGYRAPLEKTAIGSLGNRRYILYVGGRWSYKNFPFFVHGVSKVMRKHSDLFLVCTGYPFSSTEKQLFEDCGIGDKVLHCFLSDNQMFELFSNAECFIYPSKMEGFGMPILEAFAAKCPTLLSNKSCFPEIGGNAALYFEDGDIADFVNKLEQIITSKTIRDNLVINGVNRVKKFTWESSACKLASIYERLCR